MSSFRERLSHALQTRGLIEKAQLQGVLDESVCSGRNFARLLIERGLVAEGQLLKLIAEELGIPTVSLAERCVNPDVARLIPKRLARYYTVIPLEKTEERLLVAMADPLNLFALDDLKMLTRYAVEPVLAPASEIRRAIERTYGSPAMLSVIRSVDGDDGIETALETDEGTVELLAGEDGQVPVVKALNLMIVEAIRKRASDIHLEPTPHALKVRYRIDGHLLDAHQLPKATTSAVLTRLKIMSGLNITEWRLPQDGRFKVRLDEQEIDFRVSVLPITHGGKAVLRLLDKRNLSLGLEHLGFLPESIHAFQEAVRRPYGMILVTGPTGSGKSTTLYSILNQLNIPERNLITIEDPVEYQLNRVTQVQVHPEIGLSFAAGLRALLRQNPDVVMIGEIRDFETADIAMKASLTGQLVLTTLHTNDAPSAITRLIDMGAEPFLVASSVTLIEAQRLIRKLCEECRKPAEPPKELLEQLGWAPDPSATFYQACGCHLCNGTGYHGRLGIIEVCPVDGHIQELIVAKAPSWEIKRYAVEQLGMTTLRQDGLKKASLGLTTLEELVQVTAEE